MKLFSRILTCLEYKIIAMTILFLPTLAHAHPGASGHSHGFLNGFIHPLMGPDHICAMLAIGILAVQCGGRALWLLPSSFVSSMMLGGLLGMKNIPFGPVEVGISISVLILGLLIACSAQLPVVSGMAIASGFALFHGYAHGAEMPDTAMGLAYGVGFSVATAGLHMAGISLGLLSKKLGSIQSLRLAGGAFMIYGIFLCLSLKTFPHLPQTLYLIDSR